MLQHVRAHAMKAESPIPPSQAVRAYAALNRLSDVYPGFESWYWTKVVPGLLEGTRELFIEQHAGKTIGVVIAKAAATERKLCTVWVDNRFAGCGLGGRLMRQAMEWLGTERPLISVPQERLAEFWPVFTAWRFDLVQALRSYYRPGRTEYVFNGVLPNGGASRRAGTTDRSSALDRESKIHSSPDRLESAAL